MTSPADADAPPEGTVELRPSRVRGALAAPASKSITNRLLVTAALADGESVLRDPLDSDDSRAMRGAMAALGAGFADEPGAWRVDGTGGRLRAPRAPLDAGLSGTTMRFVSAVATLAPGPVLVTGGAPLLARPIGPLVAALRALGAAVVDHDGLPPVEAAGGGLAGGEAVVDVAASSQFASAVLLVAPYAAGPVTLAAVGEAADAYVELTVDAVAAWGAEVRALGGRRWRVEPGGYRSRDVAVEYDASAACHLFALAAATGGEVTVRNARAGSRQPDAALPELLEAMGCAVVRAGEAVTVRGPERLAAVDADLAPMPDQVTTMAALAALADGVSELRGVGVARAHETDRLAALAAELGKLGVDVEERADALRIRGGVRRAATLATHDDHRLAMAFASVGAAVGGLRVADAGCVAKTYPRFWHDARALGVDWQEAAA